MRFFRENAQYIGLGILIFFGATMFAGSVFFGGFSSTEDSQTPVDFSRELAVLGDKPVPRESVMKELNRVAMQLNLAQSKERVSPEIFELLQHNALMQVVNNMVLLQAAKESNLKVDKKDVKTALQFVYQENDLKDKRALKQRLKDLQVPYKQYMASLKEDILVKKFVSLLHSQVSVSDDDVENKYAQVLVRHILFAQEEGADNEEKRVLAQSVYDKIKGGLRFEKAVQQYSEELETASQGGRLGWFGTGQMVQSFEDVAFSLKKGDVSEPFVSDYGIHILKVDDRRVLPKPESFDLEKEKVAILAQKRASYLNRFIQSEFKRLSFEIQDPFFKAYEAKLTGDVQGAVRAYQLQISQNPYSPHSHYLLGQVYFVNQEYKRAIDELRKASVKAELSEGLDFPELHLLLGRAYLADEQVKDMLNELDKAFELGKEDLGFLKQLKQTLEQKKLTRRLKKVDKEILRLEVSQRSQA